eukprot:9446046-Pyramimonas_sp.AAC.1
MHPREAPRTASEGAKRRKSAKTAEDAPKRPPRSLQEAPQKPPKGPQKAPQRPHSDWSVMLFSPLGELRRSASQ